jgi:hypothetical protein
MLKRWPTGIQWLVGIAAVVLTAAIVWALFVPLADWLAHHDVGSSKDSLATARDAARGRLLTLGAGLGAAGALLFTARNFTLSRRTFELTEQGQVTDASPRPSTSSARTSSTCASAASTPSSGWPGIPQTTTRP